jgi:PEP-CTERM motif
MNKAWWAILFLLLLSCGIAVPAYAGSFVNGGFEDGTLNGWTQGGGYWQGEWPINPNDYLPGGSTYNPGYMVNTVVAPGADPIVGNLLNRVYSGNYSARVNDWNNNNSISVISQTVQNYTDPNIYFAWAAVLESSHGTTDSDNFILKLTDDSLGKTLYQVAFNSADAQYSQLFHQYGYWFYTDWQVQQLDVSQFQGDTFTLTLLGSDCPYGGHAGYVYLDGFGAAPPSRVPEPSSLILLGSSGAVFLMRRVLRRK